MAQCKSTCEEHAGSDKSFGNVTLCLDHSFKIEWNGYETRQTPLLYVFGDLKVHKVQKNSYHFDCIDQ